MNHSLSPFDSLTYAFSFSEVTRYDNFCILSLEMNKANLKSKNHKCKICPNPKQTFVWESSFCNNTSGTLSWSLSGVHNKYVHNQHNILLLC